MKYLYITLLLFSIVAVKSNAQNSISGYVNIENTDTWQSEIHLSKINLDDHNNPKNTIHLTSSPIDKNGYFSFSSAFIDEQNQLYKLHINPIDKKDQKKLTQTVQNYKLFILSKKDSIYLEKGTSLFGDFTTSSKAHKEWKRFQQYQNKFDSLTSITDTEEYLLKTRGYVKDSLHILLVKLIGIKKLDTKKLLEKDIRINTKYYTNFLDELKSSDLNPELFLFLENRLLKVTGKITEQNYKTSYAINIFAFLVLLATGFLWYRSAMLRKKQSTIPLSKQETIIRDLIISGKSNKEIADTLYISLSTVKTHISNIYTKLNISNRKELLR